MKLKCVCLNKNFEFLTHHAYGICCNMAKELVCYFEI